MTKPAFTSNKFCLNCKLRRGCKKICSQLETALHDAEQKEYSLFIDPEKRTSDRLISKIEGKLFRENKTLTSQTWGFGADELSHSLEDWSLPHLSATENKICYLFKVCGHSHKKIAEIMKIKKLNVKKIYSLASEKARLGTQGMAEKHPGRYSRKYLLVKPGQTKDAVMAKRAKS